LKKKKPEVTPEKVVIYLPSNFTSQQRKEYELEDLGAMDDALERLRECLAEKSLRFRTRLDLQKVKEDDKGMGLNS